jgi:ferredoxin
MTKLRVWIDQDLCTGDGICVEICPPLFDMHGDGLAYVKEADWADIYKSEGGDPKLQMAQGTAAVPDNLVEAAIEAAEECPGECIFFDVED